MAHCKNIKVILSSPSGVGKTTLTKKIQQKYQSFKISVSHTTRPPRSNEVDGVDYHFVSKKKFEIALNNNVDISKNIFFTTPIYNLLRILTSFSVKNRYLPLTVFFFVKPAKEVLSNLVTKYPRCSKILLTILFFPI